MNFEENRLRSFEKWPSTVGVDPRKIAKAGFYYMGQNAEVQCFCCGSRISEWDYEDKPMAVITRHKMLDPGCPFVKNPITSGNIPVSSSTRRISDGSQSSAVSNSSPDSTLTDDRRRPGSSISLNDDRYRSRNRARDQYSNEQARLESYVGWPVAFISTQQLAKAGFFYTGHSDKVECYFCGLELENWEEGDIPLEEHRRGEPNCQVVISLDCGVHLRSHADSAPFNGEYEDLRDIGVHKHRIPRSPKYSTYEARLRTFKNWPPSIPQTPHQLADAGFYFTGRGDQVRCFHCDGGLKLWEAEDDPWEQHARWFTDCGFLFLTRGQQFIESINSSQQLLDKQLQSASLRNGLEGRGVKRKQVRLRQVSDEELQTLMSSPHALAALEVGLESYRVKLALKQRLETHGEPFSSAEDLIQSAVSIQADENPDDNPDEVWSVSSLPSYLLQILRGCTPPNSPAKFNGPSHRRDRQVSSRVSPAREILSSDRNNSDSHSTTPSSSCDNILVSKKDEILSISKDNGIKLCDTSASSPSKPKTVDELEEEIKRLRESRQCKVCMDNEVGVVLLPCGHLVTCSICTQSLSHCPLCRQSIQAVVRTFLS